MKTNVGPFFLGEGRENSSAAAMLHCALMVLHFHSRGKKTQILDPQVVIKLSAEKIDTPWPETERGRGGGWELFCFLGEHRKPAFCTV